MSKKRPPLIPFLNFGILCILRFSKICGAPQRKLPAGEKSETASVTLRGEKNEDKVTANLGEEAKRNRWKKLRPRYKANINLK